MLNWFIDLGLGLWTLTDPAIFLAALGGVFFGAVIGFIPGLGPTVAISLAIPISYKLGPLVAIGMMLGFYKGGTYGGSISAISITFSYAQSVMKPLSPIFMVPRTSYFSGNEVSTPRMYTISL